MNQFEKPKKGSHVYVTVVTRFVFMDVIAIKIINTTDFTNFINVISNIYITVMICNIETLLFLLSQLSSAAHHPHQQHHRRCLGGYFPPPSFIRKQYLKPTHICKSRWFERHSCSVTFRLHFLRVHSISLDIQTLIKEEQLT